MKKAVSFSAMGMLCALAGVAGAEEVGRVISSTPVVQQVAVPRQVCNNQPMVVQQPNSGAGAVMGGIAGGAMGNAIGSGSGRAAATVIGLVGGALLGNNIEGSGQYVQNVPQCSTQAHYENRTVAYNVVYEYGGKEYNVQMPQDPGPTIRLQLTPVGSNAAPDGDSPQSAGAHPPGTPLGVIVGQPNVAYSGAYPGTYPAPYTGAYPSAYPAYPMVHPAYYPRPYFHAPIGLSLNLGYVHRGGHRHGHRHRH